jgi:hypothetical protein
MCAGELGHGDQHGAVPSHPVAGLDSVRQTSLSFTDGSLEWGWQDGQQRAQAMEKRSFVYVLRLTARIEALHDAGWNGEEYSEEG